ncbi:hypothetical protein PF008_g2379 [Phytophthora fragariae]|uniref:Uncharacterized protein n=1 Tax=Phytophthora fragariae TaxID=53985 RepID=A0A6G0SI00_9STRA|nr:hypothetical protein PF008_g2379 [Phytophthora fragariae]
MSIAQPVNPASTSLACSILLHSLPACCSPYSAGGGHQSQSPLTLEFTPSLSSTA